jgi:hypothetical protein
MPAKAGIQGERQNARPVALDSRFRGNDDCEISLKPAESIA